MVKLKKALMAASSVVAGAGTFLMASEAHKNFNIQDTLIAAAAGGLTCFFIATAISPNADITQPVAEPSGPSPV